MWRPIKIVIAILLLPLLLAFAVRGLPYIASLAQWETIRWAVFGFVAFSVLPLIMSGPTLSFFAILNHELTHTLVGLVFGHAPRVLQVEVGKGGLADGEGGIDTFLVTLAPYCVPFPTLTIVTVHLLFPDLGPTVFELLIGATLSFHYMSTFQAMTQDQEQPDFVRSGSLFSAVMIVGLNLIVLVFVLFVLADDLAGIVSYFQDVFALAPQFYKVTWAKTLELLSILQSWLAV